MGLGKTVEVRLDKYFAVLSRIYNSSDLVDLKKIFKNYGLNNAATVYSGEPGDGVVIIKYGLIDDCGKETISGVLRFSSEGKVFEGLRGKNVSAGIDKKLAKMFIYGLFGAEEIKYGIDGAVQIALDSARGCWTDENSQCALGFLDKKQDIMIPNQDNKQYVSEEKSWVQEQIEKEKIKVEKREKDKDCWDRGYDYSDSFGNCHFLRNHYR